MTILAEAGILIWHDETIGPWLTPMRTYFRKIIFSIGCWECSQLSSWVKQCCEVFPPLVFLLQWCEVSQLVPNVMRPHQLLQPAWLSSIWLHYTPRQSMWEQILIMCCFYSTRVGFKCCETVQMFVDMRRQRDWSSARRGTAGCVFMIWQVIDELDRRGGVYVIKPPNSYIWGFHNTLVSFCDVSDMHGEKMKNEKTFSHKKQCHSDITAMIWLQ